MVWLTSLKSPNTSTCVIASRAKSPSTSITTYHPYGAPAFADSPMTEFLEANRQPIINLPLMDESLHLVSKGT